MTLESDRATSNRMEHPKLLLATLALAQMLIGIDYNIVFVALPQIASLGYTEATLQWVISGYALAFGALLLLGGRLADTFGRRRLLLLGLALYAAGSILGATASGPAALTLGRVVQGAGGAALAPAVLALLATSYPEGRERNRAYGIWGAAGSGGMVLGSILGGVLTQAWGWRAIFWVNVPLVVLGMVLALRAAPADRAGQRRSLDLPGAVLTSVAAAALVLGFSSAAEVGWLAVPTIVSGVVAVVALVLLIGVESRVQDPLLDFARFANPHLRAGVASTFVFMAGFGATAYFLTSYLQQVRGLDALVTGLAFVVPCAGVLIGTNIGARLATTSLRRAMIIGQLIGAVGCLALALVAGPGLPILAVLGLALVFSLGQRITFTTMFATAATGTPDDQQGIVGGMATTGQQLGGAVGLAVLVSVVAMADGEQFRIAMGGITVVIIIGVLIALGIPRTAPK